MTIINTTADLIRLLEENDEFRQAVRRHVLTDELVRLPEQFAKFATDQRQINQRMETFVEDQKRFNQRMETFVEDQKRFNQRMETFVEDQRHFNQRMDRRLDKIDKDMGQIKAGHALMSSERNAVLIADLLDLDWHRTLHQRELARIARTLQLSRNERISFIQADLIIVATDNSGTEQYLAVEVSFTADRRDTDRALRNARFLQQGTGLPAIPAIASVHNDRAAQSLVDSGTVRWIELTNQMMEVR